MSIFPKWCLSTYPDWAKNTMNVGRQMVADDFVIAAPPGRDRGERRPDSALSTSNLIS